MRVAWPLLLVVALVACKRESEDDPDRVASKKKSTTQSAPEAPAPASSEEADPEPSGEAPSGAGSSGPRYLRPTRRGKMVDAFRFGSVPASIVEQEVGAASTRADAIGVLRRFGLPALEGKTGEVWIAKASLVDDQARERILVASFRSDADSDGMRDEDDWIVFLGSTHDDRIMRVGSARLKAKSKVGAPVDVDARELHASSCADAVATWSSCGSSSAPKACYFFRAWSMQRGYPEQILDVAGESPPKVSSGGAPHEVVVDGKTWRWDESSFKYK